MDIHDPAPPQRAVLDLLAQMLDSYAPSLLDRQRSMIRRLRASSPLRDAIAIEMVHADENKSIHVDLGRDEAVVTWLSYHEHIEVSDDHLRRAWTTQVVDAVATILRGDYELEEHYRGNRWIKTRFKERPDPEGPPVTSEVSSLLAWLIPFGAKRIETHSIGFGVQQGSAN